MTEEPKEAPAIINISYGVNPVYDLQRAKTTEYSSEKAVVSVSARDEYIRLCYSSDYEILKDEYIVHGDFTYHHLIARRKNIIVHNTGETFWYCPECGGRHEIRFERE